MARGEGRGARASTARHRAFAERIRKAQAEARIAAEVRVYREQPTYWLSHAARTRAEREGWTADLRERLGDDAGHLAGLSDEELQRETDRLAHLVALGGASASPPCSRARCRCEHHVRWRERYPGGMTP